LTKLFARAASCDVTPKDRAVRLAGYASRNTPVSRVLDPIEISVVMLECAAQRCLIFSFDLMIVGSELQDQILARLERLGFGPQEVVLLASHTHFAPATDEACARLGLPDAIFVNELADATEKLARDLQRTRSSEVRLEILQDELDHSINRRRYWPLPTLGRTYGFRPTSICFAPNPTGPRDERVTVVLLREADNGQVLAVLWHYCCHPTAVVPQNVISADYPGTVRAAMRERFGDIPCIFVQGFCGDIRPNIRISHHIGWRERARRMIGAAVSGPSFARPTAEEWMRWSRSLATAVCEIAQGSPSKAFSPTHLRTGSAQIPLSDFFAGTAPDKPLAVQVIAFGEELEMVALSAEACIGWQRVLDEAAPLAPGRIRLYAGYLGALFGYLPTAEQVPEGGYEVEGFQPLFGLSGSFLDHRIGPAVAGCVKRAIEDLEQAKARVIEPMPSPEP